MTNKLITGFLLTGIASLALGDIFTTPAIDNATIQPAGPRGGTNGKRFFNIEGNAYGPFASFGVVDFDSAAFGLSQNITDINSLKLSLYHAPAGFSVSGSVDFWITSDTTSNIQPVTSTFLFDAASLPSGLGSQLNPRFAVGTGTYTQTEPSQFQFDYTLNLSQPAKTYLISQINAGGRLRLIVSASTDTTAATYFGHTATLTGGASAAPFLTMDASSGSQVTVNGTVTLQEYNASVDPEVVTVEIRDASNNVLETIPNVGLDAAGNYSFTTSQTGVRTVSFQGRTWLTKAVSNVNLTGTVNNVNASLFNGDCDGDDVVDLSDYTIVAVAFNALPSSGNWNVQADLNGDGVVDLTDYTILAVNFNKLGE